MHRLSSDQREPEVRDVPGTVRASRKSLVSLENSSDQSLARYFKLSLRHRFANPLLLVGVVQGVAWVASRAPPGGRVD